MAMNESKKLKTIAFDLDTKALEEHYPKGDWHNAYYDIKNFLKDNGFIWQQGSLYDSKQHMDETDIADLMDNLCKKFDWLIKCTNSIRAYDQPTTIIDYTNYIQTYQIRQHIDKSLNLTHKATLESTIKSKLPKPKKSFKRR